MKVTCLENPPCAILASVDKKEGLPNRSEDGRNQREPNEQKAIGVTELWLLRYLPAKRVELLAEGLGPLPRAPVHHIISGYWSAHSMARLHLAISSCEDSLAHARGFLNVETGVSLAT